MPDAPDPTLELPAETMRALGYRVVDLLVDHLTSLDEKPVIRTATRDALEPLLDEPLPEQPGDPEAAIEQVVRDVFSHMAHVQHPRFFGYVPGPSNFVAVLADALAAGFNPFAGTWLAGSGPIQLELVTIDWLRQLCGLPESAGGIFVSGGSAANLTALAAARHAHLGGHDQHRDAVVYTSDQTHSASARALRVLGFGDHQLRSLPCDETFRLPVDAVVEAIRADRAAGKRPFCIIANAGTTSTGAVDPLGPLADVCRDESLWLHADAAYGGGALLSPRGATLLDGIERVDSLALDPHKWLFQPFESGCVLLRDAEQLRAAFHIMPAVLRDIDRPVTKHAVHACDYGVQLSRSFRALKLWLTFKVFGAEAVRAAVERGFDLAERAEVLLRDAGCWQITSPAQLAVVAFRYRPQAGEAPLEDHQIDHLHATLIDRLIEDGTTFLSSTVLAGQSALRMCPINPRTTDEDLERSVARLSELAREVASESADRPER